MIVSWYLMFGLIELKDSFNSFISEFRAEVFMDGGGVSV